MTPAIFEIFNKAAGYKNADEQANFLRQNADNRCARDILVGAFHPRIVFNIPDTNPTYSEADPTSSLTRLYVECRKFDIFVESEERGQKTKPETRQMVFVEMLENLHPADAKIILNMVNKKEPVKGLTHLAAHKAFPQRIPAPTETTQATGTQDTTDVNIQTVDRVILNNVVKNVDLEDDSNFTKTGKVVPKVFVAAREVEHNTNTYPQIASFLEPFFVTYGLDSKTNSQRELLRAVKLSQ